MQNSAKPGHADEAIPPRPHRNANPRPRLVSSLAMSRTSSNSKRRRCHDATAPTLAKALAPEEIRPADFVAVLHEIVEWPSWFWCDDAPFGAREEIVRICTIPREAAAPLKVRAVCLPFVLVRASNRREYTIDVRRHRLARLDATFARAARQACRRAVKKRHGRKGARG
jgi:hypothetical protein